MIKGKVGDIEKAILEGVGVLGMSKTRLGRIKSDKKSAIISVNRGAVDSVKACFALWPSELVVQKISGTLKGLRKSK